MPYVNIHIYFDSYVTSYPKAKETVSSNKLGMLSEKSLFLPSICCLYSINRTVLFAVTVARRATEGHTYIFEGFPQLSGKNEGYKLDDDVMREVDEVLIEPNRIIIKVAVGKGTYCQATDCCHSKVGFVFFQAILVRYTKACSIEKEKLL